MPAPALLDPATLVKALPDAAAKLSPVSLARNPVMFIVEIGALFSTVLALLDPSAFAFLIAAWLWITVLFANLAEAVAESRGKAQAATLRRSRTDTRARRLMNWKPGAALDEEPVSGTELELGDHVVVEAGEVIPATATSSRGSPASTSRRSPESRHR